MTESPYTAPTAPVDPPAPADQPEMERPKEIDYVIWLVIAGFIVGWIGTIFTWDYQMSLQTTTRFLIGQAAGLAFAAWIYYKIYQGRNWARILVLVLAVFGWLMLLVPAVNQILLAAPPVSKAIMVFGHLVQVAELWFLFFSPGRHWFKKRSPDFLV